MKRPRFARPVREKNIEDASREYAEHRGGRLIKTVALGWPGFPDRMLLLPGFGAYVEFKRGNEQPTDLQAKWHAILKQSGFEVFVVRSLPEFAGVVDGGLMRRRLGT